MEPHFPEERRTHRVFSGIAVVLTMVSLVLVFMLGVIVYKLLVYRPLAKNPSTKAKAQQIANMTGAMVNLMTIMILSRVRMVTDIVTVVFCHSCMNSQATLVDNCFTNFSNIIAETTSFSHYQCRLHSWNIVKKCNTSIVLWVGGGKTSGLFECNSKTDLYPGNILVGCHSPLTRVVALVTAAHAVRIFN